MEYSKFATSAAEMISGARLVLAITHERPDGDAISSLCALNELIRGLGVPNVQLVCKDPVPGVFHFLPCSDEIALDFLAADVDLIITVDCRDLKRTGFPDRLSAMVGNGCRLINIDHHPKNDLHRLATLNIFDESAASSTQIISNLAKLMGTRLTPTLATCIYTGLCTDTGSFQHPNTSDDVLNIASESLSNGARIDLLQKNVTSARSVPMLKVWGVVLERMQISSDGIVSSVVTKQDLLELGATHDDTAGLVNMLELDERCRVAILYTEIEGRRIKVSLRSNKSKVDVSKIAKLFGAGGHPRAAGFEFDGQIRLSGKHGWKVVI